MPEARKHRRRWLQFSLRVFLLAVSGVAVMLGLFVSRVHRQRQVAAAIRKAGGSAKGWVAYPRWWPTWLCKALGDDLAPRGGWSVHLKRTAERQPRGKPRKPPGDELLALTVQLGDVYGLYALETTVTDEGLRHLRSLRALRLLNLCSTNIGDPGMEHLRGMISLRELRLFDTRITDKGLESIGTLCGLQSLFLDKTRISDAGLRNLAGLSDLQVLSLWQTGIGDAGLKHLSGLTHLYELDLNETLITDGGMRCLANLRELQNLSLDGTSIGDAALSFLDELPLSNLAARRTNITGRGFKGLFSHGNGPTLVSLDGCPVDDEGLRWIAQVRGVAGLSLSDTDITDAGLPWLLQVDDGCEVVLHGTSVTDAGLTALRTRRGKLKIHVGGTAVTQAGADALMQTCPDCTACVTGCLPCFAAAQGVGLIEARDILERRRQNSTAEAP
jgi:internalin A